MDAVNDFILIAAFILLVSMLLSAGALRMGAPLLLVFLLVGMLAGEAGPGGIQFDSYPVTYLVGVVALAVILFDGGLRTNLSGLRVGLKPALSLATLGVVVTTAITGFCASWLLELPLLEGLLMGAIIGSTDAAAVFSLLQSSGIRLNTRVSSVLELESGSNDPMAVFLTLGLVALLQQQTTAAELPLFFIRQMALGGLLGWAGGRLLALLLDRLHLDTGTYALLALAAALFIFAVTNFAGGSGFLAIYLVGIILNRQQIHDLKALRMSLDSQAWLAQVVMFLVLGLIATPAALLEVAWLGLSLALVLILVARPLAVLICLAPFKIPHTEKGYIAWVGLRGAVPIVLALFPLMAELPNAPLFFNVAFFVVLISLLVQGWSTVPLARYFNLYLPPMPVPLEQVELYAEPGQHPIAATYRVTPTCRALGLALHQLPPHLSANILRLGRDQQLLQPQPDTRFLTGDYLYTISEQSATLELAEWFNNTDTSGKTSTILGYFSLNAGTRLSDIGAAYAIPIAAELQDKTIAQLFTETYGKLLVEGDRIPLPRAEIIARRLDGDRLTQAGLRFLVDTRK